MTIRSPESSGTEMKVIRIALVLLALLMLFTGCAAPTFLRDEDGYGYTEKKSGRHYAAMNTAYEAARAGEQVGEYKDKKHDVTRVFLEIPGLDTHRFLTDATGLVYCTDDPLPSAADWTFTRVRVCEEEAVSVERGSVTDAAVIAAIRTLWFEGAEAELPAERASHSRRLKLQGEEYPEIYYCFRFFVYGDGSAYFYLAETRRAVAVSPDVAAAILRAEGFAA